MERFFYIYFVNKSIKKQVHRILQKPNNIKYDQKAQF